MTDSNKKTAFQILIGYRKCCFYDKICCNDLTIHVIVKIQNNLRRKKVKMIQNPILPGFNPDPCICRKGDDYYLAVSTFEWFPGIPVYHSRDLKNWELYTHVLTDDEKVDLKKLPSAKGICTMPDLLRGRRYVLCGLWSDEFHERQIFRCR